MAFKTPYQKQRPIIWVAPAYSSGLPEVVANEQHLIQTWRHIARWVGANVKVLRPVPLTMADHNTTPPSDSYDIGRARAVIYLDRWAAAAADDEYPNDGVLMDHNPFGGITSLYAGGAAEMALFNPHWVQAYAGIRDEMDSRGQNGPILPYRTIFQHTLGTQAGYNQSYLAVNDAITYLAGIPWVCPRLYVRGGATSALITSGGDANIAEQNRIKLDSTLQKSAPVVFPRYEGGPGGLQTLSDEDGEFMLELAFRHLKRQGGMVAWHHVQNSRGGPSRTAAQKDAAAVLRWSRQLVLNNQPKIVRPRVSNRIPPHS